MTDFEGEKTVRMVKTAGSGWDKRRAPLHLVHANGSRHRKPLLIVKGEDANQSAKVPAEIDKYHPGVTAMSNPAVTREPGTKTAMPPIARAIAPPRHHPHHPSTSSTAQRPRSHEPTLRLIDPPSSQQIHPSRPDPPSASPIHRSIPSSISVGLTVPHDDTTSVTSLHVGLDRCILLDVLTSEGQRAEDLQRGSSAGVNEEL